MSKAKSGCLSTILNLFSSMIMLIMVGITSVGGDAIARSCSRGCNQMISSSASKSLRSTLPVPVPMLQKRSIEIVEEIDFKGSKKQTLSSTDNGSEIGDMVSDISKSSQSKNGLSNSFALLPNEITQRENFYKNFFKSRSNINRNQRAVLLQYSKRMSRNLWALFNSYVREFGEDVDKLNREFGEESPVTKKYINTFIKSKNLSYARQSLVPEELRSLPNSLRVNEIYGLLVGQRINRAQGKVLTQITQRVIPATPERFDNYVIVDVSNKSTIIRTTSSILEGTASVLFTKIELGKFSRVIVKGSLRKELIEYFSKKGVQFIRSYDSFTNDLTVHSEKIRFLYVISKKKEKLRELFNTSKGQLSGLLKIVDKIESNDFSKIVDSEDQLLEALKHSRRKMETPIVVFNNIDNRIFGKTPTMLKFSDFITCHSHDITLTEFKHLTTDFIYLEDLVQSIAFAKTQNVITADEFWFEFAKKYNQLLKKRRNFETTVTVVIGSSIVGAGGFAIYYSNSEKNTK